MKHLISIKNTDSTNLENIPQMLHDYTCNHHYISNFVTTSVTTATLVTMTTSLNMAISVTMTTSLIMLHQQPSQYRTSIDCTDQMLGLAEP